MSSSSVTVEEEDVESEESNQGRRGIDEALAAAMDEGQEQELTDVETAKKRVGEGETDMDEERGPQLSTTKMEEKEEPSKLRMLLTMNRKKDERPSEKEPVPSTSKAIHAVEVRWMFHTDRFKKRIY